MITGMLKGLKRSMVAAGRSPAIAVVLVAGLSLRPPTVTVVAEEAASADVERMVALFDRFAFGGQVEGAEQVVLRKWTRPLRISIIGDAAEIYRPLLMRHVAGLAFASGVEITFDDPGATVIGGEPPNLFIELTTRTRLDEVAAVYRVLEGVPAVRSDIPCRSRHIAPGGTFDLAAAIIAVDADHRSISRCIRREMMRALGWVSYEVPEDDAGYLLDRHSFDDLVVTAALYDARLVPGMSRADALKTVRAAISDLLGDTAFMVALENRAGAIAPPTSSASGLTSQGGRFFHGLGGPPDLFRAAGSYLAAARLGDANAQYQLGFFYRYGWAMPVDLEEAAMWHGAAAAQGHAAAQYQTAVAYHYGASLERDVAQALGWYRKAALQGHLLAQVKLGRLLTDDPLVEPSLAEAVKWYRMAADQGDLSAQINLGRIYSKGDGVARDYAEAARWYRAAAERGVPDAQLLLATFFERGQGVSKDLVKAATWYLACAEQDHPLCRYRLLQLFGSGREGIPRELIERVEWFGGFPD